MEEKTLENGKTAASGNASDEEIFHLEPLGPLSYNSANEEQLFLGLGDGMGLESLDIVEPPESPSTSRFEALSLFQRELGFDSGTGGGGGSTSEITLDRVQQQSTAAQEEEESDPFAMLEAAIEEDKPK